VGTHQCADVILLPQAESCARDPWLLDVSVERLHVAKFRKRSRNMDSAGVGSCGRKARRGGVCPQRQWPAAMRFDRCEICDCVTWIADGTLASSAAKS